MKKIAFIFPGQGSQYVGMGKEVYLNSETAREIFTVADEILGRNISTLCFEGPEAILRDTRNSQLAIITTSVAILKILQKEGLKPDFTAGHSLGEYSALIAADAIPFSAALKLVASRSRLMAEADPEQKGGMAAILGVEREVLAGYLSEISSFGQVEVANFNCPGQIVVSGAKSGLTKLQALIAAKGGRVISLPVSGAFHSSFMNQAAAKFRLELETISWHNPSITVIANVSARSVTKEILTDSLFKQIVSPVLWEDTINYLKSQGVNTFVEVGPGKVLSGLVKRIIKDVTILNCEDLSSIKKALAILREV